MAKTMQEMRAELLAEMRAEMRAEMQTAKPAKRGIKLGAVTFQRLTSGSGDDAVYETVSAAVFNTGADKLYAKVAGYSKRTRADVYLAIHGAAKS